jgi:tetratricopeptide (TPR) repeat protein
MPAHIYMRVGQYDDAVVANDRAAKADRKFINNTVAQGFYPGAYYPHNLHFLWQALVFEGRSKEAMKAAVKVSDYAIENYCGPNKALEGPRQRHLPQLTAVRFGWWDQVLTTPKPSETNDFLIDRAMWHYCRGLAYAARQQADDAARELKALSEFAHSEDAKKINSPQFPATSMLAIAEHLLAGKVAGARGDTKGMIAELEKAVAAEDALPYMEPGYWPFSTRPTLASALLQSGDATKAEQVFREDLARWPRNGWGLFGLEKSLRAQQKDELANVVQRQLAESWKRADIKLDLAAF